MNREERVRAAIAGQEPDRVPVSVWMHFPDKDQDARTLAEHMVWFNEEYDYDFIKMMPMGAYVCPDWGGKLTVFGTKHDAVEITEPGIVTVEDYMHMEPLDPTYGTWGRTLQLSQWLSKLAKPNTPYIQTIFSPASILKKLTGAKGSSAEKLKEDMKENAGAVHYALEVITETVINFVKANADAGVSGFFFATQEATYKSMDDLTFAEFCKPYDIRVLNECMKYGWFNVLHIHGTDVMWETLSKYPCNVINWHDRFTAPDLKDARGITSKCLLGGLAENPGGMTPKPGEGSVLTSGLSAAEIKAHVKEAIDMVDGKGLMIGPGCVADTHATPEALHAVRAAVER